MGSTLYAVSVDQWMLCLNMDLFSTSQARLYFIINHWAKPIWPSKKTRKDWVSRDTQRSRLYLSVPFTDHVVLLDCLNWHCVAFTLCCRNAHWQKAFFFFPQGVRYFCPSVCFRLCSTRCCEWPCFDYKESLSPAFWVCFLYLFVLNVPPQCNVALLIPLCVSPLPITISCLL